MLIWQEMFFPKF